MRLRTLALSRVRPHQLFGSESKPGRLPLVMRNLCLLLIVVMGLGSAGLAQCEPGGFCQVGFHSVDFDTWLAVNGGNVGIGTNGPVRPLHVFNNGIFSGRFETSDTLASVVEFRNGSSNATWEYGVTGSASFSGLPSGSMYISKQGLPPSLGITPSDKVGIGTSTPGAKLDVLDPSPQGTGVRGEANNGSSAFGVWGRSTSGFAGYFSGNTRVVGTFSVTGAKQFTIDHPLDPANKYLNHSCVESSDVKNIYDGVVALDSQGEAEGRCRIGSRR